MTKTITVKYWTLSKALLALSSKKINISFVKNVVANGLINHIGALSCWRTYLKWNCNSVQHSDFSLK